MSTGYGHKGGPSRCFPFWMDFSACMWNTQDPANCGPQFADYNECLHHVKETSRLETIRQHKNKWEKEHIETDPPAGAAMKKRLSALPKDLMTITTITNFDVFKFSKNNKTT